MNPAHDPEALPLDQPVPEQRPPVWCADCHRVLHATASRLAGRGPDCKAKHGDRTQRRTDGHQVAQDALPGMTTAPPSG